MAFSDEIENQSVNKYRLVRFEVVYNATNDLVSVGGDIYQLTNTLVNTLFKVRRNDFEIPEVEGTPSANDEWSYNTETGLFQIKRPAPPSETNAIFIHFYLFFTSGKTLHHEDPEDTGTTLRDWEPRLFPFSVTNSIENILNGVVSASASSITVANNDRYMNVFLNKRYSFYNRDMRAWQVVNNEIQKLFVGISKGLDLNEDSVTIAVEDSFSRFEEPAFMGDNINQSTYNTTEFPSLHPDFRGQAIPYVFTKMPGDVGYSDSLKRHNISGGTIGSGTTVPQNIEANFFRCVPTNFNTREYTVCRCSSNGRKVNSFGTISSIAVTSAGSNIYLYNSGVSSLPDPDNTLLFGTAAGADNQIVSNPANYAERTEILITTNSHNMNIGESFAIENIDPNASLNNHDVDGHFVITKTTSTTIHAMCTNLLPNLFDFGMVTSLTPGDLTSSNYPAIFVVQGGRYYFMDHQDIATFSETSTSSGNKLIKFTLNQFAFTNTITTNGSTGELVDPANIQKHQGSGRLQIQDGVYCRFITNQSVTDDRHDQIVKKFFDSIGVPINNASLTQAASDSTERGIFTVPFRNETRFESYRFYLERFLQSMLGVIYIDNNFEANYVIYSSAPSATDTRTIDESSTITVNFNYRDIVNRMFVRNIHDSRITSFSNFTTILDPGTSTLISSQFARNYYNINKEIVFEHLTNNNNRPTFVFNLLSDRQTTYTLNTAHKDLLSLINNNIKLQSDNLLGDSSQDAKIIGVRKSDDNVTITLTDLEGLT